MAKAKVIFDQDITKVYSNKVQEYMNSGWMIHPVSMRSSQGEIAKVDFTNGKDVIRVMLNTKYVFDKDEHMSYNAVELQVELHKDMAVSNLRDCDTIWNGHGEIVEQITWFEVNDFSRRKVYVQTLEEIREIWSLHMSRYECHESNRHELNLKDDAIRTKVRDICRKHKGYARVKRAQIEKVTFCEEPNRKYVDIMFTDDSHKASLRIYR